MITFQLPLLACATCMGNPGDKINMATGSAILLMLYVLAALMLAIGAGAFTLMRRAKRHARENEDAIPTDPHLDAMLATLAKGGDMQPFLNPTGSNQSSANPQRN